MSLAKNAIVLAAACLAAAGNVQAQSPAGGSPPSAGATASSGGQVMSQRSVPTAAMQRLQDASDRLRQSIQALAQKPPGPERERAIASAHQALMRTQQAMLSLPPELRSSGTVSTADYDRSVKALMASADSLRHAIQAMAQQPAGERREQAIRDAHEALGDTQAALVAAYQPGAGDARSASSDTSGDSRQSMGAAGGPSSSSTVAGAATRGGVDPAAVLVLLPSAQAGGGRLADGCWVRFFDDRSYRGAALTLAGPVDLPRMEMGNVWRDWDSAIVGPKATVRTFDNENFQQRTAVLNAGQSIPDLRDGKLGWFEEVKSARVSCG